MYICYLKDTTIQKDTGILLDSKQSYMILEAKNLPPEAHNKEACAASLAAIKDALYVVSGKWKLQLIISMNSGPKRFKEIQRDLGNITPKILSKELKELELNGFVLRKVYDTTPVTVTYELTPYSSSLDKVISELKDWGMKHRKHLIDIAKTETR